MAKPPTEKAHIESSTKLPKSVREGLEALAFADDRKFAYVLRRAAEEGLEVLRAKGVAPKRAPGPAKGKS